MHDGMKLSNVVEKTQYGELLCRTDLTHISARESDRVMCREASSFLTGALYNSILHERREGLLAQRGVITDFKN
jgi:hypothetical protein